jgi:hypothetical protein
MLEWEARGVMSARRLGTLTLPAALLFCLAADPRKAVAAPDHHPTRADLPRARQVWRMEDVRMGGPAPVVTLVSGTPVVFVLKRGNGAVVAVDVRTGRARWTVDRPTQASRRRDPTLMGPPPEILAVRPSKADESQLSVVGQTLSVKWTPDFESKLAVHDGRVLASGAIKQPAQPALRPREPPERAQRWRIAGSRIEEEGAARGKTGVSFAVPPYLVDNWGLTVRGSGDRLVLVESNDRVDPQATLTTWTLRDPRPVVLRRPAVTTIFALLGDLLLASGDPDHVIMALSLTELQPPLSTLPPDEAVAAARAEAGRDLHMLYEDLAPLTQLGSFWLERLRRIDDPLYPLALLALADRPAPQALPLLLAQSRSLAGQGPRTAAALAAQDDPRAGARLLELMGGGQPPHAARMFRDAAFEQHWRSGRTAEGGLCKPHGEEPVAALAQTSPDGSIGTAHPFVFQEAASDGRWILLCQAREDTDHDGAISVMTGRHGESLGDSMRPYLVVGSGPGAPFDEILAVDPTGRFIAARNDACLSLIDTRRKTAVGLRNADLRNDDDTFGSPRGASFDGRGERLLYLRGSSRGNRVVVRILATGAEIELDPGPGVLWRAHIDPNGRWIMADMLADGRWPRVMSTLARRTCRGEVTSYTTFGRTFEPRITRRWARTSGGPMREVEGLIAPFGGGVLIRAPDGALHRIGARGQQTEIVPASCGATVVGLDRRGRTLAAVCARTRGESGMLTVFGSGPPVPIRAAPIPTSDRWSESWKDVIEWEGVFVDLRLRRAVGRPAGCCATSNRGIRPTRPDGAELRSLAKPPEESYFLPKGPLRWVTKETQTTE